VLADRAPPARLGRYEVLGSLARGGMAELFVARLGGIEGFSRRVVVKRVLPGLAGDREFVDMFLEEARLAATLEHRNIVQVHDIGHDADGHFFAMELLQGSDVAHVLRALSPRRAELPLAIALEIARGACAGLHYAHERLGPDGAPLGLVHRDVSPQNLFVTFDGAVKLLDFGIAKAAQRIADHVTRSGTLRGKLPYMSPEQCRGEALDRRSDIFSLSVVLWEMTVGARLYGAGGEGDFEVLKSIADQEPPPPSSRRPDYPPELERIVLRGLRRDRAARYQTADELAADLEAFTRARSLWVSPREMVAFMAATFPDQAVAWRRAERETSEVPAREAMSRSPGPKVSPAAPEVLPTLAGIARPVAVAGLVVAAAAAIGLGYAFGRGARDTNAAESALPAPEGADAPPPAPVGEDAHWFQPDDYLVSKRPYEGGKLTRLRVAKPLGAPPRAGARATFLDASSNQVETTYYWRTRPARIEDLKVGALAFCMARSSDKTAAAPEDKQRARVGDWILASVTEIADVDRGTVSVGGVACAVAGVRVLVEPAAQ
jgi:serine/threonine protein kinase